MNLKHLLRPLTGVRFRVLVCAAVLLIGISTMYILVNLEKPPSKAIPKEVSLHVTTLYAKPENVTVTISGYGEVKVLKVVDISPEVSGKIINIHPRLEPGEIISKGETLFEIDMKDYQSVYRVAKANVLLLNNSILRLNKKHRFDYELLKTLTRNQELAKDDYYRLRKLFDEHQVGTRSNVEKAEQAWNMAMHRAQQLAHSVELYPVKIKEEQNRLDSAKAKLSIAKTNLSRCKMTAPFTARIKNVSLETDQFVFQGNPVITIADDSIIEIHVPIDSLDAKKWLRFSNEQGQKQSTWFRNLEKVPCQITWTEDTKDDAMAGVLHRIVKFDSQTRTLTVAIRIDNTDRFNYQPGLPMVEGMFCRISIPGRTLPNVFKLPRHSVSFEKTVYLSFRNRLKTIPVTVAKLQDEYALISGGINSGDMIITTRLVNPLENSLLVTTGSDDQIAKKLR